MRNFKFIISYDGSRYFGWERQPGRDTIQGKLEAVLTRMCGTDVQVIGAGRTDAGVHAKAMAANAYMDTEKTPEDIRDYMNRYLPDDICVQEAKLAADRFHARYRAVGKLYTYTCYVGDTKPVFNRKYVTVLDYQPDLAAMQRAAEYLTGEHDYKSFCSNPQMKKSTVRIVDSIEIVRRKDYIYFNYGENIYKAKINSTKKTKVISNAMLKDVSEGYIYYTTQGDDSQSLYKMRIKNKAKTFIKKQKFEFGDVTVEGGYILMTLYYRLDADSEYDAAEYLCNTNGKNGKLLKTYFVY